MTRTLLLNCGPHGQASHGYQLATDMLAELGLAQQPLLERDLVATPIPPIGRDYALAITSNAGADAPALAWSETLIKELEDSDLLLIVTPMHNFAVPATLKLWLDQVIRIHRSFAATPEGKIGLMKDRPTLVLVSSGGFHAGPKARQEDFLTPYLRYALASIGIRNVHFVLLQGLVFGPDAVASAVGSARDALREQLAPFKRQAQEAAAVVR
ncbi:NAD(P)H-dependent oxidoreductase [Comamonas piscis]|uniref:FMN dependent NADH:quinone oxidoreductase n=1 Tax=Comamonas piscis TaxID=1562974 RepID=A0A7G5EHT1_9BURK|nr:NAD(P)H-dependent oxidoreductase [Comamonas piscis]QMV73556.1 NAD(P)H-dependent oxidoreductase [Comamonas piscis]WSO31974.1 NAD(P)H-dependent oxidoreductase [Comamonas piscis]